MAVVTIRSASSARATIGSQFRQTRGYDQAKAFLVQVSGSHLDQVYRFPYAPVETSYESLSSEYEEIKRPTDYSYIARRGPQLARVSFEFRVAHRPTHGYVPIIGDLEILRAMALADVPVALVGMGEFLLGAESRSQALQTGVRNQSLFRIMEMGITVVRRSPETNEPTQADCRITLIEDRNPVFNIVSLPKIEYEEEPPAQTTNTSTDGNGGGSRSSTPAPMESNTGGRNYSDVDPPNNDPVNIPSGGGVVVPGRGRVT